MTTRNITVTSKNQVTLPAEYVRRVGLNRNRVMRAELRGDTILLTPQATLGDSMRQFWGKHQAEQPLTDEELKKAIRSSAADHLSKEL